MVGSSNQGGGDKDLMLKTTMEATMTTMKASPTAELGNRSTDSNLRYQNSKKKKNIYFDLLALPTSSLQACKPCNRSEGLALGDRPITVEELNQLTPDDLEEHTVTRNGVELSMAELAELLDMPPEFAEILEDEDLIGLDGDGAFNDNENKDAMASFLPPNADELLFLAFADQFR